VADPPSPENRLRARDVGIVIGTYPAGRYNAITDVAGVRVGHVTLSRGEGKLKAGEGPVRTGVTAVLPHGGDLWNEKVCAAGHVLNGNGETTGLAWVNESGLLEIPIVLTNTLNVGRVSDGVVEYMLRRYPDIGIHDTTVLPVVGECDDGRLNDIRGRHVTQEDVVRALEEAKEGPVEEGAVGAGTGMVSYGFKGGIGTSSRLLPGEEGGYTVGVLVNANHSRRSHLMIDGVPVGREIPDLQFEEGPEGSIIIVVATDAPLTSRQLARLCRRAQLGLARTGAISTHGSGDFIIAFSTAQRVPHRTKSLTLNIKMMVDDRLNPLFQAVVEATEEAIVNALTMATTTVGRDGNRAHAIPLDRLREIMRKYGK
jgi:D-aminopeptidase